MNRAEDSLFPVSRLPSEEVHRLEGECLPERGERRCGAEETLVRTIDGTCNNLERPFYGAANVALRR